MIHLNVTALTALIAAKREARRARFNGHSYGFYRCSPLVARYRKLIEYRMSDGREVSVEFNQDAGAVLVRETFDSETENTAEVQRQGWQAILDNFARHVEGGAA